MLSVAVETPDLPPDHRRASKNSPAPVARTTAGALTSRMIEDVMRSIAGMITPASERSLKPWGYIFPFDQPTMVDEMGYTNRSEYEGWRNIKNTIAELIYERAADIYGNQVEIETNVSQVDLKQGILNIQIRLLPPVQIINVSLTNESAYPSGPKPKSGIAQASPPKNLQPYGSSWMAEV